MVWVVLVVIGRKTVPEWFKIAVWRQLRSVGGMGV